MRPSIYQFREDIAACEKIGAEEVWKVVTSRRYGPRGPQIDVTTL